DSVAADAPGAAHGDDAAAPRVGDRVVLPAPAGEFALEAAARRVRIAVVGEVVIVVAGELAIPGRLRSDLSGNRRAIAANRRLRLLVVEEDCLRRVCGNNEESGGQN